MKLLLTYMAYTKNRWGLPMQGPLFDSVWVLLDPQSTSDFRSYDSASIQVDPWWDPLLGINGVITTPINGLVNVISPAKTSKENIRIAAKSPIKIHGPSNKDNLKHIFAKLKSQSLKV